MGGPRSRPNLGLAQIWSHLILHTWLGQVKLGQFLKCSMSIGTSPQRKLTSFQSFSDKACRQKVHLPKVSRHILHSAFLIDEFESRPTTRKNTKQFLMMFSFFLRRLRKVWSPDKSPQEELFLIPMCWKERVFLIFSLQRQIEPTINML